jgi:predicted O-methyltransferase YrrM
MLPATGHRPSAQAAKPVNPVTRLFRSDPAWRGADEDFLDVWRKASDIVGWLSEGQARALYRAAGLVPERQWIVEIGSHHGRSTVFLASAKPDGVRMMAIDPFVDPRWGGGADALASFRSTVTRFGLTDQVEIFRGLSTDAAAQWDGGATLGLLFVDGAHDRTSVLADIDGWEKHIAPGGLVAFHDAFSSIGVTQAVVLRHLFRRRFRFVGATRTLVVFQRADLGRGAAFRSASGLATKVPYFVRSLAIKLALRRRWRLLPALLRYRAGDDLF